MNGCPMDSRSALKNQREGWWCVNGHRKWTFCLMELSLPLSHCGWNSVMEALGQGVPILGWPVAAEQFCNAKLLEEEVGVCVEVARGRSVVGHEDLAAKIELVMNGTDKGIEMATKACQVKEMIKNAMKGEDGFKGSSVKAMGKFLNAASLQRMQKLKNIQSNLCSNQE
ncbi:hypothetical protein FNV43_RR25189 [Rhamnella rubrinervis]|uniref:Uncharacterized protein n=1 Tax=Rhamnella rubrinervis TaxID=2594499 RepID=A0A8K0DSP4_9ROSA|nr:hypothetical protein FNV43_RR25189 [Rhamnella rubrinervis]